MCIPSERDAEPNKFVVKKMFKNLKTLERCTCDGDLQDALAKSTIYTKKIFTFIDEKCEQFKKSPACKVLFKTTQPAHMVMILAVAMLAFIMYPSSHQPRGASSKILNFIHLGAFSTYMGSQIWMTFVSGLSLYFALPRHHFGNVQRVLFPKYFALNSLLSFIIFSIYARNVQYQLRDIQLVSLAASFLINLLIRLYLAPPLLRLMLIKNRIEEAAGIGLEIGTHDAGPLKNCPHYIGVYKAFRKVHMTIAMGNIVTMGCTIFHLYYLSIKLCDF